MFEFDKKLLFCKETRFEESIDNKTGRRKYYLHAKIVPRDKISRNKVLYNWDTIKSTINKIPGLPLMHNHKFKDANILPRGEWIEGWVDDDGAYGIAEIYDTDYNKDYLDWIRSAKTIPVSLQVTGRSKKIRRGNDVYQEAFITDWYEISTVNVPGFNDAKSSLETVLAEALNDDENDSLSEGYGEATEAKRKQLGMSVSEFYAVPRDTPSESKLPIYDKDHVLAAMSRFNQTDFASEEEKSKAKNKIISRAKKFGLKIKTFGESIDEITANMDKVNQIANRRYGRNFDALNNKEQRKVIYSSDIEKMAKDKLIKMLDDKLINDDNINKKIKEDEEKSNKNQANDEKKEESIDDDFFSDLLKEHLDVKSRWFIENLGGDIMDKDEFIKIYKEDLANTKESFDKIVKLIEALTEKVNKLEESEEKTPKKPEESIEKDEPDKKEEEPKEESAEEEPKEEEPKEESAEEEPKEEEPKEESAEEEPKEEEPKEESAEEEEEPKEEESKEESAEEEPEEEESKEESAEEEPKEPEVKKEQVNFDIDDKSEVKTFEEALQEYFGISAKIQ